MDREDSLKEHDNIFDQLKLAVKDACMKRHEWDSKAEESLVSEFAERFFLFELP